MRTRPLLPLLVLIAMAMSCTTSITPDLLGMSFSDRPLTGKVIWNDLLSSDPVASTGFYRFVGGYEPDTISRRGGQYTLLKQGGIPRAGVMQRPNDDVQPVWLTHFGVADPATVARKAEPLALIDLPQG